MTVDDAYAELGLPPGATLAQAKAAWRSLVSRWHPDRNGHAGASARMQRINRALEQIRAAGEGKAAPQPARKDPAPAAVHTAQHRITLTLEEAATGCIKQLHGSIVETCVPCAGSGHAVAPQDCPTCAGKGQLHERTWFGWYAIGKPCIDCNGTGTVRPACAACEGSGKKELTHYRMSVRLPTYTRDGDALHVPAARGRAAVALDIHIAVLAHASLVLDTTDGNIRCELPVDGFGWIANRTVDVPTLRGPQPLRLQRGQVLYRLAGLGFPPRSGGRPAEQIVIVVPRFPEQLSRKQERLLEQLAQTTAEAGEK
jgi:molecular chaperone DnaJ